MEKVEDEMLMRLADGEMPDDAAEALLQRIEAEPDLAARFALFAETRDRVSASFAPLLAAPVPERLVAAVLAADAASQPANDRGLAPWVRRPLIAACLAALLAAPLGFLAGRITPGPTLAEPLAGVPAAMLAAALETTPSGETRREGDATVQPFATHLVEGGACRDFVARAPGGAALGLACRAESGWHLRASLRITEDEALRPASADHPALAAMLASLRAAPPLDADSEAALIRDGWRGTGGRRN